jgi:selenocysteine lyase/cysteine desulfurase
MVAIAKERFRANPRLRMLGNPDIERLGVFSLIFEDSRLHHNLAVRLLNDRFGIQVRAGCMCAGTYGHSLLGIEHDASQVIRDALDGGALSAKPGWVRISLSPATSLEDLEYMLDAVDTVTQDWEQYAGMYVQDETGEWIWAGDDFVERFAPVSLKMP